MLKVAEKQISIGEYFELCENSEEKYEYWDGEIFKMAGSRSFHGLIVNAIIVALSNKLFDGGLYGVHGPEMKLELLPGKRYVHPDVQVSAEPGGEQNLLFLSAPILIFEVLSPSTAKFDKTTKMKAYFALNSLYYYALVEQDRRFVTLFTKDENAVWNEQNFEGSGELFFEKLDVSLTLDEIYEDVAF